ncbi:MAG TPA: type II toxin-antitoxin system Phd/YefM family antitoxin [Terriglobia bacterium]|nr:type II toxin-antitoxin system Phd/YefM family antitoxin [Terriglobia bacterium]
MAKDAARRTLRKVTVRQLQTELQRLRRRVEDLEDLRDLNAAIERNAGKHGIPWSQVKKELGL